MSDAVQIEQKQSRLGKRPVTVPKGVKVEQKGSRLEAQGPQGKLGIDLPQSITIKQDGEVLRVVSDAVGKDGPRLQGLGRALLQNVVTGVAEGYTKTLELIGTGYRAELKGKKLTLTVGKSHPEIFDVPDVVTAEVPSDQKGTVLILKSVDKAVIGQFAATLRGCRPPEPYGGKGVRYRGERIRRKAGKAGKGGKK